VTGGGSLQSIEKQLGVRVEPERILSGTKDAVGGSWSQLEPADSKWRQLQAAGRRWNSSGKLEVARRSSLKQLESAGSGGRGWKQPEAAAES
jgi:hypothetical protein